MNVKLWMVDTTGSPKHILVQFVKEKEDENWRRLESSHLDQDGNPKYSYYPQYDQGNKSYGAMIEEIDTIQTGTKQLRVDVIQ